MSHPSHADQLARLRRVEGQVRGVIGMIEEGRYCVDILTQLRAVYAALRKVEERILRSHIEQCVVDAARSGGRGGRQTKIDELMDVVGRFST
jgi:DNA-binding FrmR family transcriptional regulator